MLFSDKQIRPPPLLHSSSSSASRPLQLAAPSPAPQPLPCCALLPCRDLSRDVPAAGGHLPDLGEKSILAVSLTRSEIWRSLARKLDAAAPSPTSTSCGDGGGWSNFARRQHLRGWWRPVLVHVVAAAHLVCHELASTLLTQAIARHCLEALVYLHHLNILMKSYNRCEIKAIDLGSSCF